MEPELERRAGPGGQEQGSDLHLPEGVGAGGRGGGLAQCGAQEHLQLALVLVTRQELLLLRMEQPHHVPLQAAGRGSGGTRTSRAASYLPPTRGCWLGIHVLLPELAADPKFRAPLSWADTLLPSARPALGVHACLDHLLPGSTSGKARWLHRPIPSLPSVKAGGVAHLAASLPGPSAQLLVPRAHLSAPC